MVRVRFGFGFEVSIEDLEFRFDLFLEGQN